jgi:phenylacetate-coenzyme A ligase PaaK-like adenylate-forming protein
MLRERCRRFAYFSLHRLIGSSLSKHYREFLALEQTSSRSLRELRAERLKRLLLHSSTAIPFYRRHVQAKADLMLRDFPVLTKHDIHESFHDLMAPELLREYLSAKPPRGYSWMPVQTGGSTGMPTTVIHDREFRDFNRAARLYTQYVCGFPIGTRHFKLWGSMREINDAEASPQQRVASRLAGEVVLNAFRMGESELDAYVKLINESSAEHMLAYADAAQRMADYIRAERRSVRPLKSIMACAGTLTDAMRQSISEAFGGARIHNMYGSRDCGALACECSSGSLHILENKVILEIVDRNGEPVPAGERGRILVTLLGNAGFPLVRYDIGDVGAFSERTCDCGLPTSILDRVEGRSVEFLVTSEGGYVSPSYFIHLIGVVHNPGVIRRFQIVQHARDRVVLLLEVEPGAADHVLGPALQNIRRDLLAVFGRGMNLQIDIVSRIQESASGKFIFALNKTGQVMGQ